jgi:arylsulfatase A-like enzyme
VADPTGKIANPRILVMMRTMVMLMSFTVLQAAPNAPPPHIIHIMADDTGWNDLGFKNGLIRSPNIDKLAMSGIRMNDHYAFKVCSPSRASFHTGRMAYSMGLYDNSPAAVPWLNVKTNAMVAGLQFKLLPELLQTQNYTCEVCET